MYAVILHRFESDPSGEGLLLTVSLLFLCHGGYFTVMELLDVTKTKIMK